MNGFALLLQLKEVTEVYTDLFTRPEKGAVLTLSQLSKNIQQFCSENLWIKGNVLIQVTPGGETAERHFKGAVQSVAQQVIQRKFRVSYDKPNRHSEGKWHDIALFHPTSALSQQHLAEISPERIQLQNRQGVYTPLPHLTWGDRGPIESEVHPKSKLGAGGFGRVFKACMLASGSSESSDSVAVKFFYGSRAAQHAAYESEKAVKLQDAEGFARLLGGCIERIKPQHPAVKALPQRVSYLVYELYSGDLHKADGLPIDAKLDLLRDVLRALIVLHSRNLLHCDLRFSNILVQLGGDRPRAFIGDLGLTRFNDGVRDKLRSSEQVARDRERGCYWQPPEAYSNLEGTWSDVYALSFVAARLLSPTAAVVFNWHLQPPAPTAAGYAWRGVANWVATARSLDIESRRHTSVLHLAYSLMRVRASRFPTPLPGAFSVLPPAGATLNQAGTARAKVPKRKRDAVALLDAGPAAARTTATRGEILMVIADKIAHAVG
jgi:hypothetical protein